MGRARLALNFMALLGIAGVAAGAAYGIRGTGSQMVSRAGAESVAAYVSSPLPAAVVVAKKPTLPDIVDLILGDRQPERGEQARIAAVLGKYTSDPDRANRIAAAVIKEGRRRNIGTSLLVGVLLTENPDLDPHATSAVGARGLMQVMPFHAGKWGCGSTDLFDIESNICHGARILADNLKSSRTLPAALLGYNGCVRGTNTPNCWRYPSTVYKLARKGVQGAGGA